MESLSLQNGNGRGRRYKEEDGVVPTSPSRPPSAPRCVARAPKCPRSVSPRENRRKRVNLPHERKLAPGGSLSPPRNSEQTVGKASSYRPTMSRSDQAASSSGAWLAASSTWRWLCVIGRFLLTFLLFSLLFRVTHLSGLLEQSLQSRKRTQKWRLMVYLDQCNLKYIYLQK